VEGILQQAPVRVLKYAIVSCSKKTKENKRKKREKKEKILSLERLTHFTACDIIANLLPVYRIEIIFHRN
jgi:hypothetical protein